MRFRYSFSSEHDTKAPVTVRGEFDKPDVERAFKSAVFLALKTQPRASWRSWVCCIEQLEPVARTGAEPAV